MVMARRRAGALATFPTVVRGARWVFHARILLLRVLVAFQRGYLCLLFIFIYSMFIHRPCLGSGSPWPQHCVVMWRHALDVAAELSEAAPRARWP